MIQSTLFSIITRNYNFILWVIRNPIVFSTPRISTLLTYHIERYMHICQYPLTRRYTGGREEGRGVHSRAKNDEVERHESLQDMGGDPVSMLTPHLHSDLCCRRRGVGVFFLIQGSSSYSLMKILLCSLASYPLGGEMCIHSLESQIG